MILSILGAGGHGQDIADIAQDLGWVVAFHDDGHNYYAKIEHSTGRYIVGVNEPKVRKRIAARAPGVPAPALVHPTAVVSRSAILGRGVVVGANTTVGPGTVLNDHVHIGAACTITRTLVGAFSTIGPGCDIAGDCRLGHSVFLGVGVVVRNLVTIHNEARVGAGAVVLEHVAAGKTVVCRDLTATGSKP